MKNMSTRSWKKHDQKCRQIFHQWQHCVIHKQMVSTKYTNVCRPYFKEWLQCTNKYLEFGYREDPDDFK